MFLIFGIGHPDMWSPADYGLKKAVEAHFGGAVNTTEVAQRWRPYRSYATLYLGNRSMTLVRRPPDCDLANSNGVFLTLREL